MADLEIRDIHEKFKHVLTADATEYRLLQYGLFFKSAKKKIQTFGVNCHYCRLRKSAKGQNKFLLNQSGPGPTEELAILFSPHNLAPHSDYQIDLTGPLEITV